MSECNVHIKLNKCEFLKTKTVYLGSEYGAEGIKPVKSFVEAILKAPVPTNVAGLVMVRHGCHKII